MQTPEISIVVPVYNLEKYLEETVKSIQAQTFQNFEVIFVDDGSTDRSYDMLSAVAEKDSRFSVMRQARAGAGAARNHGFTAAKGTYTIFLDGDDLFEPVLLEKLWEAAEREQADIAACHFSRFDGQGYFEQREGVYSRLWLPKGMYVFNYRDCPNRILSVVNPTPWNKLYRTDFIREHHLKFEEISSTNDITFAAVSVASAERIVYVPEYLVHYRVNHSGTITSKKEKNLDNIHIAVSSAVRQAKELPYKDAIMESILYFAIDNYVFALRNYISDFLTPSSEKFYTEIHNIFNGPDFAEVTPEKVGLLVYLYFLAVKRNDYGRMRTTVGRKLTVSLTSYPKRIGAVAEVLKTIYAQTLPADRVVLWLAETQFPEREDNLPAELRQFAGEGKLEIHWVSGDLRPHKKYLYAAREYPDDVIVTIDDDMLYPEDTLAKLFRSYRIYPDAVSALRAHLILFDENNRPLPYGDWIKETDSCVYEASMQLIATGCSGVLYPPGCFRPEFLDEAAIVETCLNADDLWLKAMEAMSGIPVAIAGPCEPLKYVPGTQETALCLSNLDQNQNDVQLANIAAWMDKTFEPGILEKQLTTTVEKPILGREAVVAHLDKERKMLKIALNVEKRNVDREIQNGFIRKKTIENQKKQLDHLLEEKNLLKDRIAQKDQLAEKQKDWINHLLEDRDGLKNRVAQRDRWLEAQKQQLEAQKQQLEEQKQKHRLEIQQMQAEMRELEQPNSLLNHLMQAWKGKPMYCLAWLPCKLLGFLQCVQDHGFFYTIGHGFAKVGKKLMGKQ